ncbi:MAG: sigma-54-dependent transcriptional response regulator, partial [Candidatus Aminicenantes bacterium]|nr:sigma-54-dependent transcriptional response regulator [Candidatus Aminicenantes bacterium]
RVGSAKIGKVDVRVIAATNKDLASEMKEGRFREDLFFRLNVVPLHSPPLRDRKEDIPLLVAHFTRTFCEENNFKPKTYTPAAMAALCANPWKGNVRELRNVIERLIILTEGEVIDRKDLPDIFCQDGAEVGIPGPSGVQTLKEFREIAEKEFILAKLKANGWNISQTAREIDTPRSNLYKKLEQYGIKITPGVDTGTDPENGETAAPIKKPDNMV